MNISPRSKDCNLEECLGQHDLCKSVGSLLESLCEFEGGPCQTEDKDACNMTVQFMLSNFSQRRGGCFCQWEEDPCAPLHLLASKCQAHREELNSTSSSSWTSRETMQEKPSSAPKSCLRALQSCKESRGCASAYENVRELCHMDGSDCKGGVASALCLSLWKDLRRSALGQCTCSRAKRKCLEIWQLVHDNPCVHKVLEGQVSFVTMPYQGSQQHIPEQKRVPKMKWPDRGLSGHAHGMNHSCSSLMKACLEDEACNSWLVPVVQACSISQCDQSQCGRKIQQFYEGLPQTSAEMLVFCSCDQEDQECEVARGSLHGGTCEPDQGWTCLEMLDSCLKSRMCRERFGTLLSKCLGTRPVSYYGEASFDWVHHTDLELTLSQERECRMAMVATMGTTLQQSCSCDGLPSYELHKCNKLHQLLHNKSVFITYGATSGAPDQSAETNQWTHTEWWLSDDFLYICVYIILAVVLLSVVITVLYKLGMRKRIADQLRYDTPSQKK
ncbi:hypothetical protein ACEWY4_021217 [Coilia grayii]|uniref:GDNF/GAS1 domain-containing protein n=1 Tax=Coilia grayii TaxID=363190 RepID=A0ABD1J8P7_9TELE